jgi:FkbM family methyltransferase
MIRQFYRDLVSRSIREPLWLLRAYVRHALCGSSRERRYDLAQLLRRLGKTTPWVEINGFKLQVDLRDDGVGFPLFVNRAYEPLETAFLRSALKPGMCFVDVGANIGYYTTMASQLVGTGGQVIAIEPDPYNFRLLTANVQANRLNNVVLLNLALGSQPGDGFLSRSRANLGDHRLWDCGDEREHVRVRIDTLDNIIDSRGLREPDFVKMDVQGYEYQVVRGMQKVQDRIPRLVVLSEYWPHGLSEAGANPGAFLGFFRTGGFEVYHLGENSRLCQVRWEQIGDLVPNRPNPEANYANLVFRKEVQGLTPLATSDRPSGAFRTDSTFE